MRWRAGAPGGSCSSPAKVTVTRRSLLGMVSGAAFAHNFSLAGGPDKVVEGVNTVGGVGPYGMVAVVVGLVVCVVLGFTMREKRDA